MPNPSDLLSKMKALLPKGGATPGPGRPPKGKWEWLAYFGDLAERSAVKKPGKLAWAVNDKKRRDLMHHAAAQGVVEVMGFVMCGMYYIMNPKDPKLARGIHAVFLKPDSQYALNINSEYSAEIQKLSQWGGFNDISAMLDSAADGIMNGNDAAIGGFVTMMRGTPGPDGAKFAKIYKDGLVKELSANGWGRVELKAIGLI